MRRIGLGTAAALLLAGSAAAVEPQDPAVFYGTWHADASWALTIENRQVTETVGDDVWVDSVEACPVFEFEVDRATGLALIDRFDTPDFTDPSGFPLFGDMAPHLDAQSDYPMLLITCIGRGEIPYTTTVILLHDDRVMEVTQGDGVADIQGFARTVPAPTNAWRSRDERLLIQEGLASLGLYPGPIDADFGPLTRAAISAFQTSRGEEPTGILTGVQERDLRRAAF